MSDARMTHEDSFREYLDRDAGRIADWASWLAETEAEIERRLDNGATLAEHVGAGVPNDPNGSFTDRFDPHLYSYGPPELNLYAESPEMATKLGKEFAERDGIEPEQSAEWAVAQHPDFTFRGPSGNPATTDLTVVTRPGATSVVIATQREDDPGISITNGAEHLAAEVLTQLFPAGGLEPFRMVMHTRGETTQVDDRDFTQGESTFHEALFADFRVREAANGVKRIGDVVNWRNFDREIHEAVAEHRSEERTQERTQERTVSEAPAARRSLRR